jgi:pimeloyl-ACP methyl ester carboxylesterase
VTRGRYDEITPRSAELLHAWIKGSKLHIFERCSHTPILEDVEKFFEVHRDFLRQVA